MKPSDYRSDSQREDLGTSETSRRGEKVSTVEIALSKPHRRSAGALGVERHRLLEEIRRLHRQRRESSPSSTRNGTALAGAPDSGASGANLGQMSNAECVGTQDNASCSKLGQLGLAITPEPMKETQ